MKIIPALGATVVMLGGTGAVATFILWPNIVGKAIICLLFTLAVCGVWLTLYKAFCEQHS